MVMGNIQGFFSDDPKSESKIVSKANCLKCGLDKNCKHPRMKMTGEGEKEILCIAEASGADEDECGKQLVGEAGQLLRRYLREIGIELDRDCYKVNVIGCRPPNNRPPTDKEIRCCRPMVEAAIAYANPKVIILLGNAALQAHFFGMIGKRYLSITNWTRHCIPDHRYKAWVVPCFHPSALLHNPDENLEAVFAKDLEFAVSCAELDRPKYDNPDKNIKILTKCNDVLEAIDEVRNSGKLFLDYETSGLKPYVEGHKVYTIAIAGEDTQAYSFPYQYVHWKKNEFSKIKRSFKALLLDEDVFKIAQGVKFENKWSKNVVGATPKNWWWCTMTTQHLVDSRRNMSRLDVQALLHYGQGDWEGEMSKYKKSVGDTGFNTLYKAPLLELLKYNAYDIFYTRKRYYDQVKFMKKHKTIAQANDLFFNGLLALGESEQTGICVNTKYYRKLVTEIGDSLKEQEELLINRGSGLKFKKKFHRDIDIQSPKDLRLLFFDILDLESVKKTKKDFDSVDEYTLSNLDEPFAKSLIKYRKTKKILDYVSEYDRNNVNGRLHPSIDLQHVATGRSSSSDPNLQNIPVRDEVARNYIRGGIIPSPGNKLMEADLKAAEVCIMADYSHDEALIKYIKDKTKDMHRDEAIEIFKLPANEITKQIRHIGKNDFVFPQFYGDYFVPCAKAAWEDCAGLKTVSGVPVKRHLKSVDLGTLEKFTKNMKNVENKFWKMLKATKQWREDTILEYRKKTFVDTYFGYRRHGFMVNNQVTNTPVQGTAFHCLLWCYVHIANKLKKNNMKTKLIGEVHDSILFDLYPPEQKEVIKIVKQTIEKDIMLACDWMVVPLTVEIDITPIDGAWNTKKTYEDKV